MSERAGQLQVPELDITPLGRALAQLETGVRALAQKPKDEFIRDAVIQRFEFTYELSIRMLRRYLKHVSASDDEVNALTFRELIQRGIDLRLLKDGLPEWAGFRQARTDTVHTYNEARAAEVAAAAGDFAQEARVLFENLSRRLNA